MDVDEKYIYIHTTNIYLYMYTMYIYAMCIYMYTMCIYICVCICNGILLSHKKEWNWVICRDVDGPRVHHTEWSQSERGKYCILMHVLVYMPGFPWWLRRWSVCLQGGRPGFNPWVGKIPWRRKWQPTPVLLPRKSHGRRSLVQAAVHGVAKSQAQLSDFTFTFSGCMWNLEKWYRWT